MALENSELNQDPYFADYLNQLNRMFEYRSSEESECAGTELPNELFSFEGEDGLDEYAMSIYRGIGKVEAKFGSIDAFVELTEPEKIAQRDVRKADGKKRKICVSKFFRKNLDDIEAFLSFLNKNMRGNRLYFITKTPMQALTDQLTTMGITKRNGSPLPVRQVWVMLSRARKARDKQLAERK